MSDTGLLEAASGDGGLIAVDRLSVLLHITRGGCAAAAPRAAINIQTLRARGCRLRTDI
jgi:hypothetical protein